MTFKIVDNLVEMGSTIPALANDTILKVMYKKFIDAKKSANGFISTSLSPENTNMNLDTWVDESSYINFKSSIQTVSNIIISRRKFILLNAPAT